MTRTTLATILIASVAGAGAGVLTSALLPKDTFVNPVAAGSDDGRLGKLEQQNAQLERAIAELRDGQNLLAARAERTAVRADSAPADDSLAARGAASIQTPDTSAPGEPKLTVESAMALLCDPETSYEDSRKIWEKANAAGLLDAIVEAMEQRAAREPNNPGLKVDLGNAYLQEVFVANTMSKGKWAMKADAAFDAALELDPQHWEARFTKAVSLSNWPAFLGKQSLAISEFETLISQQNAGPKKAEHAQTYLFLGNMYQASGSIQKAIDAWQRGVDLFPDNEALKTQLANAKKL